jgi:pimeloyl-ACP methyl ester carboxylesterase
LKQNRSNKQLLLEKTAFVRDESLAHRPTIIFLHDSLGCIELWREFPARLGAMANCNVLIYDRQGYGQSCAFTYEKRSNDYMELEADILIDLLDYWQIENPILFGHSDGGSIALITAGKYPDRIAAVITEGAHIFVEDITLEGIHAAISLYKKTDLKQKLMRYHGAKTEAMFWAWASTWTEASFRTWNIEHFLPTINCPSLIVQGANDEYGSLEQVDRIVSAVNGQSKRLILADVGHTPHKEASIKVLNESVKFLSGIS